LGEPIEPIELAAQAPSGEDGACDPEAEPQLPAGAVIGPWRVVRLLGRGGMGEVYLAERDGVAFTQRVALKVLKRGMDSRAIARRFLRERQILSRLDHPNLARLVDGGTGPDGRPFFALEWVDGEPITVHCRRRGLDLDARLHLVQTICLAVDSAHRQLVVHRDLKPGNVLVTADGTVKLLDFGIAKLLAEDEDADADGMALTLTLADSRALTPAYAAPEQILGEPVSTATDVYALGVMLYELITGALPHRRDRRSLPGLAGAVEQETIERPGAALRRMGADRRLARRVTADLDLIVLTALHREPSRRYQGAQELAGDLGNFLAGRPIQARPDDLGYRARKFLLQHRVAVAAVAVAVAALVAGLGLSIWETRAARAATRRADAAAQRAERVKAFLIEVFREPPPGIVDGSKVTARQLLAHGAATLDRELAGEPEVQADLIDAMARIETSMGVDVPALAHARRALDLRRSVLRPSDGKIGLSWVALGDAQAQHGALDDARASFKAALANLVPAFGADSAEVALASRGLATSLHGPGERWRLGLLLLAHAIAVRHLGESHKDTLEILVYLAKALENGQRLPEAEAAYRRVVELSARRVGPGNVRVAIGQAELAALLSHQGRDAEARPLFESAIAGERAALGPRHLQLASTLIEYGKLLNAKQDYEAADKADLEAQTVVGPDHYGYAICLRELGFTALDRKRYAEAADLFARAAAGFRRTLGENDPQVWRSVVNLGIAHLRLGRMREARRELTEGLTRIERMYGGETSQLCLPLKALGELQTKTGQASAAVATLRRDRALAVKLSQGAPRLIAWSDLLLARALLARGGGGDPAEARRLLDDGLDIFTRVFPHDRLHGETLLLRGRLALADGDRILARRHLAAAESLFAARRGALGETRQAHRLLAAAGG
jgi:tetratricopeptide (TPR) repeat protein/tRNA A-37 threonylcarbamoyl transferase component Bud32